MSPFSRSTSLFVARISVAVLMLSVAGFVVWTAGDLLGQPPAQKKPRAEEEEEPSKTKAQKKPKRKVIHVEEEEDTKEKSAPRRPAAPAASGDLAELADRAPQPAIKTLFRSLAVPYDLLLYKPTDVRVNGDKVQQEYKIQPTPFLIGDDPGRLRKENLRFRTLTLDWQPGHYISPDPLRLQFVRPYEKIAQDKVRSFLGDKTPEASSDSETPLTEYDKLVAAEQVLSAVLRWHQSARQKEMRSGKEWDAVESGLRNQLLEDVRLKQMEVLTRAQKWDRAIELAKSLAGTYKDPAERDRIFRPVANMIDRARRDATGSEKKKQQALERLHELEKEFPDTAAFQPLADTLRKEAQSLLDVARASVKDKQIQQARDYLHRARSIYPRLEGLGELESEINLEHPILRVGVRGTLPKYFSPAWACTENEHRAVELLFETLVKLVPDKSGGFSYCRGMSVCYPHVVPLGRQFELPRKTYWSNGRALNSTDIYFSLKRFQVGMGVGCSRVWGDLLDDPESKTDPFHVTLKLRQGVLDPLAPMTFKILPSSIQQVNDEKFAMHPVTSGPFHLERERSDEQNRPCRFFFANPSYRLRPTKNGAPHIQEIRFYTYSNAVKELSEGNLDLVLDLTADEAQKLLGKQDAGQLPIKVQLPSPTVPNRRIYFLAINTRKFADRSLREALSCAIDREKLLDNHFRAPLNGVHKALNGPFPVGSWAGKQNKNDAADKANRNLFNPDSAKLMKVHPSVLQAVKDGPWELIYPVGDPGLAEAMKELCDQVKALTGVELKPKPLSPYDLREDVEVTKKYTVAYYHYDFPDEIYWLAPLFGPPPETEDDTNNIFLFRNAQLSTLLADTKSYRDFAKLQQHQWLTQELLNHEMPFIPLWQLDPLFAYRRGVEPGTPDPQLPFSNIEEWRVLQK